MMSESKYYVRSRGRVRGPFDRDELSVRYRRGEVGRMHEISEDGQHWKRATEYPDLLIARIQDPESNVTSGAENDAVVSEPLPHLANASVPSPTIPAVGPRTVWYYAIAGEQHGPVELSFLQLLVATDQLGSNDLVWREGMPDWTPVKALPTLHTGRPSDTGEQRISAMAVTSFVLGVFGFSLGTVGLLSGPPGVVVGGVCGLLALVFGPIAMGAIRVAGKRLIGYRLAVTGLMLGIFAVCLAVTTWIAVGAFEWYPWIAIPAAFS